MVGNDTAKAGGLLDYLLTCWLLAGCWVMVDDVYPPVTLTPTPYLKVVVGTYAGKAGTWGLGLGEWNCKQKHLNTYK